MATTPVPNRISTNVPRNSATSSAVKPGFEVIAPPSATALRNSEVVYQAGAVSGHFSGLWPRSVRMTLIPKSYGVETFPLDISPQLPKIGKYLFKALNIYS